jgi:hypothetical protein
MQQLHMLVGTINIMFDRMNAECALAKRAVTRVKPDLVLAKTLIREADTTIKQLAELVDACTMRGVVQPPDVIARIRAQYRDLDALAQEVLNCEVVLAARQVAFQRKPKHALN